MNSEKYRELGDRIIGFLLLDEKHRTDILDRFGPDDFLAEYQRQIVDNIGALHIQGEPIDYVAIRDRLPEFSKHIDRCFDTVSDSRFSPLPPVKDFTEAAAAFRLDAILREARETLAEATTTAADAMAGLESGLTAIQSKGRVDFRRPGELSQATADAYQQRKEQGPFIPSGLSQFDSFSGGIRPGQFVVVGARPGVGKTVMAIQIAERMSMDRPVAFFSLEMSGEELFERRIASEAMLPYRSMRNSNLSPQQFAEFEAGRAKLSNRPLFVIDNPLLTLTGLRSVARRLKRTENIEAVFVDYLGLLRQTDRRQNRFDFIGEVSRGLKGLARELDLPVVGLSQLNRLAEGSRPTLAHLRESGSLEQDSDIVLFLHRDREIVGDLQPTELIVAKNRAGRTGKLTIKFRPDHMYFTEV